MAIYAVHSPALGGDPATAFDRTKAVRLGFAFWALVFGPLWLLAKGLWLALAAWAVGAGIVAVAVHQGALSSGGASGLYGLTALFLGFEGRSLQGAALALAGRPLADLVDAHDEEEAEARFLTRALTAAPVSPPAASRAPMPPPPRPREHDVIGLFPEAGR